MTSIINPYPALSFTLLPSSPTITPATSTSVPDPSHPATSPPSPLLALPPELRHKIYSHALSLQAPNSPRPRPTAFHPASPLLTHTLPGLPLLLTNRQIYAEARLLPFSTNTFEFEKWYGSSVYNAKRWLGQLAPWQRRQIRGMEVWVMGREMVEAWRREEGWCKLVGLLQECGRGKEEEGKGWDRGCTLRAHMRGDEVWGVERVKEALEECLRHGAEDGDGVEGTSEAKERGRVRLEIVVEDMSVAAEESRKKAVEWERR